MNATQNDNPVVSQLSPAARSAPEVKTAPSSTPARLHTTCRKAACIGSWCCICTTFVILVPMLILYDRIEGTAMPAQGKPWEYVLTDTVTVATGFIPYLSAVGVVLAALDTVEMPKGWTRAGIFALLFNMAILMTLLVG